jgi:type I restriction enzyme S subunit
MEIIAKEMKPTFYGPVPNDWIDCLFEDVIEGFSSGMTPYRGTPEFYKGNIPWITSGELNYNVITDTYEKITKDAVIKTNLKILPIGTFLMAITGLEAAGTRGSCGITGIKATTNQSCMALFPQDGKIDSKYLYHFYVNYGNELAFKFCQGTKQQSYTGRIAKILPINLPPTLTEQKAIATALSDVDVLIASLEQAITKKKAIKQGAMQALLNGKIRLQGFGEAKVMKESELGLIPEDWDVKLLPEVFDYIHGKAHEQHIDSSGRFTVVNSKFISTEGKVTKNSKENFCPARKGDILTVLSDLPNGKALAKTYYVNANNKYAVNQRICIWRSKKDSPLYLSYIMNRHKYFMKFDDGVTQTHILNHHIEKCPVLVPRDTNEQKAIGKALNDMDAEITQLESKKAKYQSIKQGMMQELLTGKTRLV